VHPPPIQLHSNAQAKEGRRVNEQATKAFLRCLGITHFDKRTGWVTSACPLRPWKHQDGSGKWSFGVKTGAKTLCKCLSCDYTGTPHDLVFDLLYWNRQAPNGQQYRLIEALKIAIENPDEVFDPLKSVDEQTYGVSKDFVFPEDWLKEFDHAFYNGQVHPYLLSRKGGPVPYDVAVMLDLRFDITRQRICFPVRDFKGQLRGLHGRSIYEGSDLPYYAYGCPGPEIGENGKPIEVRCPDIWLGEHYVDPELPIVLAESVFDLARVFQVYRNVMTPLYANPSISKIKRLAGAKYIVTLFDNDKAGKLGRAKIESNLPGVTFLHLDVPVEFGDAGATPVKAMADLLAPYVNLDTPLLT
jgi:hypothetical protein